MEWDTECVNRKLKVVVPSAGLSIPSIFCSTSGPTSVVELDDDEEDQGQPNVTCGRWTSAPNRWSAADSAASTAQATIRRKTRTTMTITALQRIQRGIHEYQCRRGGRGPPGGVISTMVGFCRVLWAARGPVPPEDPVRSPWTTRPSGKRTVTSSPGASWTVYAVRSAGLPEGRLVGSWPAPSRRASHSAKRNTGLPALSVVRRLPGSRG